MKKESVCDSHAEAAKTTSLLACIREIPSDLVPMTTNHARDSMTKIRFTTPINPKDSEAPREKKYRSRAEVTKATGPIIPARAEALWEMLSPFNSRIVTS